MQIARTTTPAQFVPDVPVAPRSLFDAVAFPNLTAFGGFGETTADRAAHGLLRAVDTNKDGSIAMDEARNVVVRDLFTSFHKHRPNDFLVSNYIEATVTYDAEAVLRSADTSSDGVVNIHELESLIQQRAGTTGDATFYNGAAQHERLLQAFAGTQVVDVVAHREIEDRMPW